MNETNSNHGLGCVVFLAMTFSSRQHFPFISSSRTPIFTDSSIDLYPDPVRDSAPPPSSSDVPSLVLSPAAGSPDSNPAPSAPSESPTDIRRSTRVRAPPSHLTDYYCYFALATLHEPHTYHKASTNPLWQQAMADELDALHKTHTWDMTTLPPSKSAVGYKWVYKIKTWADGFSTCSHLPGYPASQNQVCRLRRALYGLKQAPRAWFAKFSSVVAQQGFTSSSYDSALFIRYTSTGITLILLYVDDIIITGDDTAGIRDLQKFLSQHFEMKDFGTLSYFLGLEVTSSSDGYYLSQAKYASDLLSKAGFTNSKTVSTPLELNVKLNTTDISSCLLLAPLIMLQFFVFFNTSRERSFMVFTSQHSLPLSCVPMLMQTRARDPIDRRSTTVLKLSTVLSPMPPQNSSSFVGSWLTWVLLRPLVLLFIAIIVVLFTLPIMMFFMIAPSTLRSIVTSFVIIFSRVLFTYYLSPLRTSLLMYSPSLIHQDAYAILCPNSRWLLRYHFVFEGGC
uniref:Reverse transcriptase Ty1/copia-type domain-containing protein n=1 Tax=Fagus sylvatica TaxID=28930 RepID=A0A2N9GPK7_FAGSY